MSLKLYRSKRDFSKTSEPEGQRRSNHSFLRFCVQKHEASHLHYDFRLEYNGVLLSWAIPKGPSLDPAVKRLAIQVEDHPLDYIDFEGSIPKGNYGAGTVLLWDIGPYDVTGSRSLKEINRKIALGLKKGHLDFELHGTKLKGSFSLIKTNQDEKSWLLIKKKDEFSTKQDILTQDRSVNDLPDLSNVPRSPIPAAFKPMLATLVDHPFDRDGWLFETKWDGFRTLAYIKNDRVELRSRSDKSFNEIFSTILDELKLMPSDTVLDGEVVVLDNEGRSDFQKIQNFLKSSEPESLYYYVFDLPFLRGHDLRSLPLIERKFFLKQLLSSMPLEKVRFSDHIESAGIAFFKKAVEYRLEGIIGKSFDSPYLSARSRDWVKIKTQLSQEAVIGGFTMPRGSRKHFGALLLGIYSQNELVYIGHVGGGFDQKLLSGLYKKMEPLIQVDCPFKHVPKTNAPAVWINPKLVCEVKFTEWTQEGSLRHPIFKGVRDDKRPKEVKKEIEHPTKEIAGGFSNRGSENKIGVKNAGKVFWPADHYTKADLINYYKKIGPVILPYLRNRPVMLHRYPNGIEASHFYQKDLSTLHLPEGIQTVTLQHEERPVQYVLIQNIKTLEYVVSLGTIELHPFLCQKNDLEHPDFFVIDLDPEDIHFEQVVKVALEVHQLLEDLKIKNYCKTSGKDGLHIFVPTHAKYSFEQVKQFGEIIANMVLRRLPKIVSMERKPSNRQKRVYIDIYQNNKGQTIVAPYSLRGVKHAPVSTPLEWSEVKKGLNPIDFNIETIPLRIVQKGDPFQSILKCSGMNLSVVLKRLEKMTS